MRTRGLKLVIAFVATVAASGVARAVDIDQYCTIAATDFANQRAAPGTYEWTNVYNFYMANYCIEHPDPPPKPPICTQTPCSN